MKKFDGRALFIWIILFLAVLFVIQSSRLPSRAKIPYSEFKQLLKAGKIQSLEVTQELIAGTYKAPDGTDQRFQSVPLQDPRLIEELDQYGVKNYTGAQDRGWITSILSNVLWIGLFFFLWWFFVIRQMQNGGRQAMAFGRSKAKNQTGKKARHYLKMWPELMKQKMSCRKLFNF